MKKRCLVYAHWDPDGVVDPHIIYSLRQYREAVDHIVFVSTNYEIQNPSLDALVDRLIVRENIGFDFESWRIALTQLEITEWDQLIFTNSSIYGPVWPIQKALRHSEAYDAGLWGMTISRQHSVHLQSYFMAMTREFLTSELGSGLWRGVVPFRAKLAAIEAYELVWMQTCTGAGVQVNAIFDARHFPSVRLSEQLANVIRWPLRLEQTRRYRRAARDSSSNPTHLHWKTLLECGVPFVKVDLFTSNPYGIRLSRVFRWLEGNTVYPTDLIRLHIDRIRRSQAAYDLHCSASKPSPLSEALT